MSKKGRYFDVFKSKDDTSGKTGEQEYYYLGNNFHKVAKIANNQLFYIHIIISNRNIFLNSLLRYILLDIPKGIPRAIRKATFENSLKVLQ